MTITNNIKSALPKTGGAKELKEHSQTANKSLAWTQWVT